MKAYAITAAIIFSITGFLNASGQTIMQGNQAAKSNTLTKLASGSNVEGVYEGRCPCREIVQQLNLTVSNDCIKLKWRLTIFKDPLTQKPATYKLEGTLFRESPVVGNIAVLKGSAEDPLAIVYELRNVRNNASLLLAKADKHLLFFLDAERRFLVGNINFSFTLNKVTH